MTAMTCAAARRRLDAFHDEELPIRDQIALGAHLESCMSCAEELAELRSLRLLLREALPGRSALIDSSLSPAREAAFQADVLNRMRVERAASFTARVQGLFEDMHFVYAGVGAMVAAVVCLTVTVTMLRFAMMISQPDSLPAIVHLVPTLEPDLRALPSFDLSLPVPINAHVLMPRAIDEAFPVNLPGEAMLTLAAVVSREGQMSNIELVHSMPGQSEGQAADAAIGSMMGAMSRARFEPARVDGLPVAVNMVWLVAHTTVRAEARPQASARNGKKRIATVEPGATDPSLA